MVRAGVVAEPPSPQWHQPIRVLHLFAGPADRRDGVAANIRNGGGTCEDVDTVNTYLPDMDIADDSIWARYKARLRDGEFDVVAAGPPCGSFSPVRRIRPGPPVLRSKEFLYGFPKSQARERQLGPDDFETIRMGNLLAERTAEACAIQMDGARAFVVEQPKPQHDVAHMYDFHSFQRLIQRGARWVDVDQCQFGAETTKPTRLLAAGVDLGIFESQEIKCSHPKKWVCDFQGRWIWAAHPPLCGKRAGTSDWATDAAKEYPSLLCRWLAALCATARCAKRH